MPNIKNKIADIKRQYIYCRENHIKSKHRGFDGESWYNMAIAYHIALQILEEKGDWFPEERAECYKHAHYMSASEWSDLQLETELEFEHKNELRLNSADNQPFSYHKLNLCRLRINSYKLVQLERKEQKHDFEERSENNCLCRGAGACIQCNPRMFI